MASFIQFTGEGDFIIGRGKRRAAALDSAINGQGTLEFEFTVPGNAAFFRVQTQ